MDSGNEIKTLVFQKDRNEWISVGLDQSDTTIEINEPLTFLTYNVWHKEDAFEERSQEILKIMQESSADFICLQEVTQRFLTKLLSTEWVQKQYCLPDLSVENYTTLILSKMPCKFYIRKWPTKMGRFLLYGVAKMNGILTAVATVHLESLANSQCRKKQLDVTFEELSSYPKAIILGDFNFDWAQENKNLAPHYVDIWPYLHSESHGCTMLKSHDFIAWRPDRVLMKKHKKYRPVLIERVGMEPILKEQGSGLILTESNNNMKELDAIKTPSDHFGLKFIVDMLENSNEEWTAGVTKSKEKTSYKEKKKGNFVWIDGTKRGQENSFYLEELEKAVEIKKGEIKGFEKTNEALDHIVSKLEDFDDLTIILSLSVLHDILHNWKKELKVIHDKYVHDKHFRFKIIVFTTRHNFETAMHLCERAGFEKYYVFTKFIDVIDSLFVE